MHIRVSTRRRGDKTYTYSQLVESYRRDDGLPAHWPSVSSGRGGRGNPATAGTVARAMTSAAVARRRRTTGRRRRSSREPCHQQ